MLRFKLELSYPHSPGTSLAYVTMHNQPKCPDEYGTDDAGSAEYLASMDAWTNNFFDSHPDATMSDWSAACHQFWIDNNCTAALERYQEAVDGKADPEEMKQIEAGIQEAIKK